MAGLPCHSSVREGKGMEDKGREDPGPQIVSENIGISETDDHWLDRL